MINSPRATTRTQLLGNQIENAAQGIDLHCDQVIVANNIVTNCFIGMKAMHGSRNVLIIGNQFIKNDLWSIGLMPGTASGLARAAEGDAPAQEPNVTGGCIIANNIISDFGYGDMAVDLGRTVPRAPLRFDHGSAAGESAAHRSHHPGQHHLRHRPRSAAGQRRPEARAPALPLRRAHRDHPAQSARGPPLHRQPLPPRHRWREQYGAIAVGARLARGSLQNCP